MKRPLGRFWAVVLSMAVFYAMAAVMFLLTFGTAPFGYEGPFVRLAQGAYEMLLPLVGDVGATLVVCLSLATPAAICALLLYSWLVPAGRRHDEYLHCLRCGYILKGLSEPRCPESGERI
ncbi:MAG: hypothetical protein ABIG44_05125 [Planctomycetota bacterium]